jgi:hypothetical protein
MARDYCFRRYFSLGATIASLGALLPGIGRQVR